MKGKFNQHRMHESFQSSLIVYFSRIIDTLIIHLTQYIGNFLKNDHREDAPHFIRWVSCYNLQTYTPALDVDKLVNLKE